MKKRKLPVLFVSLLMLAVGCFAAACDEHVHEYAEVVMSPTCTERGYTTYTCACGESYVDNYVEALGHDWGEGEVSKEPTCTEAGEETFTCSRCGESKTEAAEALGHTPAAAVRENEVAATCEGAGSYDEVVYCSVCEAELSRETVTTEALGHSFTSYVSNNDATCTQDGTETAKCDRCDETDTRTDEGSALGHTPAAAVRENEVAATCEGAGSYEEVVYCSVCEEELSRETKVIAALGHTPVTARENEVAATCEGAGSYVEVVSCSVCEKELSRETKVITALGHSFTNYVSNNDATCTEDGTETAKCDRCDKTDTRTDEGSATGHTPAAAVRENEVAATCEEAGSYDEVVYCSVCEEELSRETKVIAALGHTPGEEATCDEAQTCTVCGEELAPALGHDWDDGEVTREEGCIFDGTIVYTCTRCDETYTDKIPATGHAPGAGATCTSPQKCSSCGMTLAEALGHSWNAGTVTKEPTCTETGLKLVSCTRCGATKTETITAKGHTEVVDPAVAATCTATGLTEGKHCSVCNTVLVEQEVVPMLEHDWGEGKVTTEPTCTEAGVMTYTCSHCSETKTEPITAKGHTEVTDPAVAPTCSHAGLTEGKHCSVCDTVIVAQTEIAKLAHTYVGHVCSMCYGIEMVGEDGIAEGATVAVHDPSIIVAYADADGALYPDAGENRQKMYFIFGTQLAAAYSYDMESWLMFTPTFYAEGTETVSDDYTKIFASAAAWPGYTDSDTIKGNLWAPDIIYNKDMGQWCLYYSMSGDSSNFRSSIFMMTSDNLTGPYEFVDFVVFSGFNKDTGAGVDDYKNVTGDQSVPSRYSNSNGSWNNNYGVSCIDPSVLYDEKGELWLNYGSWSGGIFLIKLDEATGLRDKDYDYGYNGVTYDETQTSALVYDPYLGVHIAGGWYVSGEGPYIVHYGDYYYLFLSYGFYSPEGGYNMRVFRSETIDGRYEDMNGNWAVYSRSGNNYQNNVSHGEVLMQNYKWSWWTGPASVAQGHNSVLVDGDKAYLIYHIKYDNGTAHHNVEVHELVFNEDGWPLAAPFQKSETDKVITDATTEQLAGSWSVILHTPVDYKNLQVNTDKVITLTSDGKVTGAYTGTWRLNGQYITITIGNTTYTGVVMEQQIEGLAGKNVAYTFTATNASTNTPLWGVKNPEGKSAADSVLNSLVLPGEILASINLPTEGDFGTTISYESSNESVLSNKGVYTAPAEDTTVTLTVTVTSGDYSVKKAFTVKVLSEASANALLANADGEGVIPADFIVAKAAPLAGETVAPVSAINASTGVSLTFRVENISTDWDVIFRAPGKDAIVYLSVLNYLGVDIFEASATLSEAGAAILTEHGLATDGSANWQLFLGSLCDNADHSCIATVSYNVNGSITFYRNGELVLTYAANTAIGTSTVSNLSRYMAEQVGSYGLEVAWPVEDLIIGYAADYTGACEHSYGAYDGDTATCAYCGGTKVRVEVGEKTYEAEFVSRANAEKVNNTDTGPNWWDSAAMGAKQVSGNFAVQYTWENRTDKNWYQDVVLELTDGTNYLTKNFMLGQLVNTDTVPQLWKGTAVSEVICSDGSTTIPAQPTPNDVYGNYTANIVRVGTTLIISQRIVFDGGSYWMVIDRYENFPTSDLTVHITGNPFFATDLRVAVGTISEGMELGNSDNSTAYTDVNPLWTGSISQGQKVTATGTATSAGASVWQGPIPYIWTGNTASLNFRPDNWINGTTNNDQATVAGMNFSITKVWQGFDPVSGNTSSTGGDWVASLVEYYQKGEFGCTIVWDYTASDVIVITMSYAWSDATFNQRYEVRATADTTLLDTYSIGLGVDNSYFHVDTITVR